MGRNASDSSTTMRCDQIMKEVKYRGKTLEKMEREIFQRKGMKEKRKEMDARGERHIVTIFQISMRIIN